MKTKYLTGLVWLMVACSGGQTTTGDNGGQSTAQLKKAAADAHANGSAQGDVCGEHGWYGDGECDTFCQDADTRDCAVGGPTACALILENSNGSCDRKPDDPCISQDPDCVPNAVHPTPGEPTGPSEPSLCPAILLLPDGVCMFDPKDPCAYEDPDCSIPTVCPGFLLLPDGVCMFDPKDPCAYEDPDCSVPNGGAGGGSAGGGTPPEPPVCAQYIEQADGICKRDAKDPCIFQDPDCHVK